MIDAHIHLHEYDENLLDEAIKTWQDAGINHVIAVANDLKSSYQTLELQQKFPDFVFASIGFHPESPLPSEQDVLEWSQLVRDEQERITAIAEIGLPHYHLPQFKHSLEHYIELLQELLAVAATYRLPVALHAVHDKAEIVFNLLQQARIKYAHFHWLKAPKPVLHKIIDASYYVSVTPEVCYRQRDQELAKQVPLKQLLIETDGPWPFEAKFKSKRTTPLLLLDIVEKLAEVKATSFIEIAEQTMENTKACYQIK
ncbi:MAG TPA: TatD family hydrolase [Bacilli bacterium]|nr:TatD family hydrolase [Bacilli bacterium]